MKVLVCDPISRKALNELEKAGFELTVLEKSPSMEELAGMIAPYHAMVVRSATKVRKAAIDAAANLKLIVRGGVGLDNIDVEYAKARGIEVRNTPGASSISVAELTFAHMLAAARHVGHGTCSIREGKWLKKQLKGIELYGKRLGLIGCGRIGTEVARRALAFGMEVVIHDPYIKRPPLEGTSMVALDELLATSDFISLHVPLTESTKNIIDAAAIEKMKQGAVLVNCARGGTVDEEAVAEAVERGRIYAAGFDVFAEEPVREDSPLRRLERVSLTPHIGASTSEAQERIGMEVARIIKEELGNG